MAGVKGRSGSGGARPGAGRKPKVKPAQAIVAAGAVDLEIAVDPLGLPKTDDGLVMLKAIVGNPLVPVKDRLRASIALAQYQHTKRGDGGVKDGLADKATKAAAKFKTAAPPLKAIQGGRA